MSLTPLRYPGGKAQYVPLVCDAANTIPHSRYVEPFAGGAAIALHFAIERATPVVINDKDPAIYAFWSSVLHSTDVFIKRIENISITMETWLWAKNILSCADDKTDQVDLGIATFFLNRCNFSGCLRANPIGGIHQNGKWQLDARFAKGALIQKIKTIAAHRHLIELTCLDAVDLIAASRKYDFIYLDPPYFKQGKKLYKDYMNDHGHERLAEILHQLSSPWVMSYDSCDHIRNLYGDKVICSKSVRYSFLQKTKKSELLISNMNLATCLKYH